MFISSEEFNVISQILFSDKTQEVYKTVPKAVIKEMDGHAMQEFIAYGLFQKEYVTPKQYAQIKGMKKRTFKQILKTIEQGGR
jgi:hypothetical protein